MRVLQGLEHLGQSVCYKDSSEFLWTPRPLLIQTDPRHRTGKSRLYPHLDDLLRRHPAHGGLVQPNAIPW